MRVWNVEVSGWEEVDADEGERGSKVATMLDIGIDLKDLFGCSRSETRFGGKRWR